MPRWPRTREGAYTFRRVVSREIDGGRCIEYLTCGHRLVFFASEIWAKRNPRKRYCHACALDWRRQYGPAEVRSLVLELVHLADGTPAHRLACGHAKPCDQTIYGSWRLRAKYRRCDECASDGNRKRK